MSEILEALQERLAQARTRALMGEKAEAMELARRADLEYRACRDLLQGYPGAHALEHALHSTLEGLCRQQEEAEAAEIALLETARPTPRRRTTRHKAA